MSPRRAVAGLVLLVACSGGGPPEPGQWWLPASLGPFRPARAGVSEGTREPPALVTVYGPAGGGTVSGLVVQLMTYPRSRAVAPGPGVQRVDLPGGGVARVFSVDGRLLAVEIDDFGGVSGAVLVTGGVFSTDAALEALQSLKVVRGAGGRALVFGRPPAGLVVRYGPAPPPVSDPSASAPGSFASYARGPGAFVHVAVGLGPRLPAASLRLTQAGVRTVRIGASTGVEMVEPGGSGVWVVWDPAPGVQVGVMGRGVDAAAVLAFARSLRPVSERRWKSFMERHGVDWRHPGLPLDLRPGSSTAGPVGRTRERISESA